MIEVKEVIIDGVITIPASVTAEQFMDEFIEWLESKEYFFGGSIKELDENGKVKE